MYFIMAFSNVKGVVLQYMFVKSLISFLVETKVRRLIPHMEQEPAAG